jgi:glycosyltransferase involved in cell wall biosynthesis
MRIAQVLPAGAHPYTGVATVVIQLAAQLSRLRHHVEVWALQRLSDVERAVYEPVLVDTGVELVPVRRSDVGQLLCRAVDVVHLHSVFCVPNSWLAARLRVPYVLSPHGGYARVCLSRSWLRKKLYTLAVEQRMVRRAALTFALTHAEAKDLAAFGARTPIPIIPNGVTPPPAVVHGDTFRHELGLDDATPLLLFVGRLDVFHKGLDRLIDGLVAAPRWRAALVGPDARGGLKAILGKAEEHRLRSRLACVGPRHGRALHEAFAAANLFCLPSRWEGLPVSLLEALSHGVPALVTPAVEEAVGVAAAGAGWVATPVEIGSCLRKLSDLDDREWWAARRAARKLADRFQWGSIAQDYAAAYTTCVR